MILQLKTKIMDYIESISDRYGKRQEELFKSPPRVEFRPLMIYLYSGKYHTWVIPGSILIVSLMTLLLYTINDITINIRQVTT